MKPKMLPLPFRIRTPHSALGRSADQHEAIAYDWLAQGGKRSRPFITLAAYDALKGAPGTLSAEGLDLPDGVKRTALAIETFHKASLVHDDIEDDDTFRYGTRDAAPAVRRRHRDQRRRLPASASATGS